MRRARAVPAFVLATAAALAGVALAVRPPIPTPDGESVGEPADAAITRSAAKELTVRELLDGRMSLAEAAAVFDRLNREPPALDVPAETVVTPALVRGVADGSEDRPEELLCLQVALWALTQADRDGGRPPGVLERRLRDEMRAVRAAPLPAVDEAAYRRLLARAEEAVPHLKAGRP